ncbi:hypothetical protein EZV73_04210 [Acidaminobacter sp. JC074]|uniref:hypothetical protein n=1 Tax=Acidaminobacter sp. JC074 TaxID=2530199 RepID=UPI001F0E07AB|nr:hypothetical protein [Acidaminobacter sp. JC074]MCH4886756.1 hypothetical protein [Acidaminobacter sp. JC074]
MIEAGKGVMRYFIGITLMFLILMALYSCEHYSKFESDILDDYLDELSEEYDFVVEDTNAYKSQRGVTIKIYFKSEENKDFDEAIYMDLKVFFWEVEVQNEIIEKSDKKQLEGSNYPEIRVYFIDKNDVRSHYISTPVEYVDFKSNDLVQNRYLE